MVKRILVLHGNRQSGPLLLGRLGKLQKKVQKEFKFEFVAPDAPFPHPEDKNLRTWWNRVDNTYEGLNQSLEVLKKQQEHCDEIVGILGFSQGARFAHLVVLLHSVNSKAWFPNLSFVIVVAGYDAPIPDGFPSVKLDGKVDIPSLHIWGLGDKLVTPDQSDALSQLYANPKTLIHEGNHYVPTKSPQIEVYLDFIRNAIEAHPVSKQTNDSIIVNSLQLAPDKETTILQEEEIEVLQAIFFEEIEIQCSEFPKRYFMKLIPTDQEEGSNWPPRPLTLEVSYPFNYPLSSIPDFRLIHENNIYEFPSRRVENLIRRLKEAAKAEIGMPSVLSCIYSVKEYLDSPANDNTLPMQQKLQEVEQEHTILDDESTQGSEPPPQHSSPGSIQRAIVEGLEIAEHLLVKTKGIDSTLAEKGGAFWTYTIGLVGKPSAGKSTFFNAASAFSKQRGVNEGISEWGGASVAAHPFTTIDPNIGYCLVPAPLGSCPEDEIGCANHGYGSTHGRDPEGRRFLPILLKDVAGLVPGAYQGRGKGNRFLNDLCDATVLVHVVDSSGTSDAQGNKTGDSDPTNPLIDMQWIRSELVEWVYGNLMNKWDVIIRKGRRKLSGMFSGYGQSQGQTERILSELEKYMEERHQRDRAFDAIERWDEADVYRLVSAFLGVRFPMALALNKFDLPTSKMYIQEIHESLPIHGAHVGTPLTAKNEMNFVYQHLTGRYDGKESKAPSGVWRCLASSIQLKEPILVFPVIDMDTYMPLPGLNDRATGHASLPSIGMIRCINGSGGTSPSCWKDLQQAYIAPNKEHTAKVKLRDAIPMKPGSTVADVFLALKNIGALGGDFVRAEAACCIGEKPKPVQKSGMVGRHNRIIRIMTNKRTSWQN